MAPPGPIDSTAANPEYHNIEEAEGNTLKLSL